MLQLLGEIGDIVSRGLSLAMGLGVFLAIMTMMVRTRLVPWRWFARFTPRYGLPPEIASEAMGVVFVSNVPSHDMLNLRFGRYFAQRIGVHREGLSIRPRRPNFYFQSPILLPWDGLHIQPSAAFIGKADIAISHERMDDAYLIVAARHIEFAIRHGAPLTMPDKDAMKRASRKLAPPDGPTARGEREPGIFR
ncbi:hypothetical protein [Aurantiacibacter rhizosphaerae]|uniref:Uncharacterized protein n=1 Tax=Aurantiacibacter rhizosphaerae TaxID=2691582 RepID=A0A844XDY2_9SPHN|nr:hypothetical protein [Aurantiacibacter rhizosphaerae]MWV27804.1 hypothetical protein [Aurantiacibacter rhizosphaerae]